jgi:hypothetical protein
MRYTLRDSAPTRLVCTFKKPKDGVYAEFDVVVSQLLAYKNGTGDRAVNRKFIHLRKICLSPTQHDNAMAVIQQFNLRWDRDQDNNKGATDKQLPPIDNQIAKELFYTTPKYSTTIEHNVEVLYAVDDNGTKTDVNKALFAYWPHISNDIEGTGKKRGRDAGAGKDNEDDEDDEDADDDEDDKNDKNDKDDERYMRAVTPGEGFAS